MQIKIKMDMMREACRPKRIVRFYPGTWKVIAPLIFELTVSGEKLPACWYGPTVGGAHCDEVTALGSSGFVDFREIH